MALLPHRTSAPGSDPDPLWFFMTWSNRIWYKNPVGSDKSRNPKTGSLFLLQQLPVCSEGSGSVEPFWRDAQRGGSVLLQVPLQTRGLCFGSDHKENGFWQSWRSCARRTQVMYVSCNLWPFWPQPPAVPCSSTSAPTTCLMAGTLRTARTTVPTHSTCTGGASWKERGRRSDTAQVNNRQATGGLSCCPGDSPVGASWWRWCLKVTWCFTCS